MPGRVADASVLTALAFAEPGAQEAAESLGDYDLYEPTLLRYELASIARKKIIQYPGQREGLLRGLEAMLDIDIQWVEPDQRQVIEMALRSGLSTYDASYLLVAQAMALQLVTNDRRMRTAADSIRL